MKREKERLQEHFKITKFSKDDFLMRKRKRNCFQSHKSQGEEGENKNRGKVNYKTETEVTPDSFPTPNPANSLLIIIEKSVLNWNSPQTSPKFTKINSNLIEEVFSYFNYSEIKYFHRKIGNKRLVKIVRKIYDHKLSNPCVVNISHSNVYCLKKIFRPSKKIMMSILYHINTPEIFDNYLTFVKDFEKIGKNFSLRQIIYVPSIEFLLMVENVSDFLYIQPGEKAVRRSFRGKYLYKIKYLDNYKVALIFFSSVSIFNLTNCSVEHDLNIRNAHDIIYIQSMMCFILVCSDSQCWKLDINGLVNLNEEIKYHSTVLMFMSKEECREYEEDFKIVHLKEYSDSFILLHSWKNIYIIDTSNMTAYCTFPGFDKSHIINLFYSPGILRKKHDNKGDGIVSVGGNEFKIWSLKDKDCKLRLQIDFTIQSSFLLNEISSDFLVLTTITGQIGIIRLKVGERSLKIIDKTILNLENIAKNQTASSSLSETVTNFHVSSKNVKIGNDNQFKIFTVNKEYVMSEYLYEVI